MKKHIKIQQIIAIFLWAFAFMLFISGLDGILTPDDPYRDGAIRNLVINVPLVILIGFLCWSLPELPNK